MNKESTYFFYILGRGQSPATVILIGEIQDKGSLQTLIGLLKGVFLAKLVNFPYLVLHLALKVLDRKPGR